MTGLVGGQGDLLARLPMLWWGDAYRPAKLDLDC